MFTTGSKFLFGISVGALAAWLVYGVTTGSWPMLIVYLLDLFSTSAPTQPVGVGAEVLFWLMLVAAFLGGIVVYTRDNEPLPWKEPLPLAHRRRSTTSPAAWPVLAAFGAGLVTIGLVSNAWLTVLGALVMLGMLVEWTVQAWSDRASDDPAYNASIRGRLMHPLEFPILAVAVVGFVVFFFSRIMLAIPKLSAVWLFIGVSTVVLAVAVFFGYRKTHSRQMTAGALVLGALAVLGFGVVGIAQGQREFEKEEVEGILTEESTRTVSDQANVFARIVFDDGAMTPTEIQMPRSLNATLLFENRDPGVRALVVHGGVETVTVDGVETEQDVEWATGQVTNGSAATVFVIFPVPGEYEYEVVSEEGVEATGVIVVL
jgi:hypothetical protein